MRDEFKTTLDKIIAGVMDQREEILRAFVAKYGCGPEDVVQIVGHDGSWRVIHRKSMYREPVCPPTA